MSRKNLISYCRIIAETGKLAELISLYSCRLIGKDWLPFMLRAAASNGHLDTVKWLHSVGAGLSVDTMNAAIFNGHLNVAMYLYNNKCPWDAKTIKVAINRKHHHIINWIKYTDIYLPMYNQTFIENEI